MTQNQPNKQYLDALSQCRNEINVIDDEILQLLSQRMKIVSQVRQIKESSGEKFFIKSGREADMIKSLIAKANPVLPKSTIISIWRKIITSSNMLEQSIKIALHNPQKLSEYNYLVREYYSDFVPIISYDSITNIVSEIEKNSAQIAVFALPQNNEEENNEEWWINLANNHLGLKVFAKIPFLKTITNGEKTPDLVALAIKNSEKSQSDNSLFCIELDKTISKAQLMAILQENQFEAKILKTAKLKKIDDILFYLVEIKGFFDENNPQIQQIAKSKIRPFIKLLGHYPTIIEDSSI